MKKIFRLSALLLSVLLLFSLLAGCSSEDIQTAESVVSAISEAMDSMDSASPAPEETAVLTAAPDAEAPPAAEASPAPEAAAEPDVTPEPSAQREETAAIAEDGTYTTKDDVALYLETYGHLPSNFITKKQAQALGWSGGGLDNYQYGACIGGDRFGNNEGLLPKASGRTWTECDINTLHQSKRGAERIVFSNDGLIYYSPDHYDSFELLYGTP